MRKGLESRNREGISNAMFFFFFLGQENAMFNGNVLICHIFLSDSSLSLCQIVKRKLTFSSINFFFSGGIMGKFNLFIFLVKTQFTFGATIMTLKKKKSFKSID